MRVLHAIHDFLPRHRAGSEIYAAELCRALARRGHEPYVLCAEYDPTRTHGTLRWRWLDELPVVEIANSWDFRTFAETYRSPRLDAQLEHVLRMVNPDLLHVHNLLNLSFGLPAAARRLGVPSVATLHEFALACPSGGQRVHLAEEHVCWTIEPERCARCFRQSPFFAQMAAARVAPPGGVAARLTTGVRRRAPRLAGLLSRATASAAPAASVGAGDIRRRLDAAREVLGTVDLWVAPSAFLGEEMVRLGLPAERLEVSDYGFPPLEVRREPRGERLRLGFVGTLVWHKGAHVLLDAVRRMPADGWELTIHGSLDTFPDYSARLLAAAEGLPVRFAGAFDAATVGEVYGALDALVVTSLWPENSPLVIHEAFQAGVPVVGARIGGIPGLVEDRVGGLLYEPTSADDLAAVLRRLLEEPGLLDRLAARLPGVKGIDEDAAEWEARYRRVVGCETATAQPVETAVS